MPCRGDVFRPGQYYHIYNRGVAKEPIFFNRGNYEYCVRLLARYHRRYGAAMIAYCLMPNHYHLLVRQESDEALSTFVRVLFNAYMQAVNRQQGRRGPLFEGRFRHVWVDREEYLIHLCRYIHLNPVNAKLVRASEQWRHSNYSEWLGQRASTLIHEAFVHDRFTTPASYRAFVTDHVEQPWPQDEAHKYSLE